MIAGYIHHYSYQAKEHLGQDSLIDWGVSLYCEGERGMYTHTELKVQVAIVSSVTFEDPGIERGRKLT